MALIDITYFTGEIVIPNTDKDYIAQRLVLFIEKYEDNFLRDVLGYDLYKSFKAGIVNYPSGATDQKWIDIIEGAEYSRHSRTHQWRGLTFENVDGFASGTGQLLSPIANYVYWYWVKDGFSQTMSTGESQAKAENATSISPAFKMVRAWNEMIDWIEELYDFLRINSTTYNNWSVEHCKKLHKANVFGI